MCAPEESILENIKKLKGDPLETLEKFAKKSHKAKVTCTKNFGQGRDSNPRPSAWQRPQKSQLTSIPSGSKSYISVAVSGSQLIMLIKAVPLLILKKCHYSRLRFSTKSAD